jgi:hypothetical protein
MENRVWTIKCKAKQPEGLIKFVDICNWRNTYDDREKKENRYACKYGYEDSLGDKTERNRQVARFRRRNYERDTYKLDQASNIDLHVKRGCKRRYPKTWLCKVSCNTYSMLPRLKICIVDIEDSWKFRSWWCSCKTSKIFIW